MSAPTFTVTDVAPVRHAVVPTLGWTLRIEAAGAAVHGGILRCQLRIEPHHRGYGDDDRERLFDLFGPAAQWRRSLQPFVWTQVTVAVPAFSGATEVTVPVECSYDLEVTAHRYLHALRDGHVPVLVLFGGTFFRVGAAGPAGTGRPGGAGATGAGGASGSSRGTGATVAPVRGDVRAEPVPLDREARFPLPVETWRALMDRYHPDSGWLRLDRETIDALAALKARRALPTWDETVRAAVRAADGPEGPAPAGAVGSTPTGAIGR